VAGVWVRWGEASCGAHPILAGRLSAAGQLQCPAADSGRRRDGLGGRGHAARAYISDCITYSGLREHGPADMRARHGGDDLTRPARRSGQAVRGLVRSPLMPPSTASAVPVVAPASGLAR
jgi:hypothetical protein